MHPAPGSRCTTPPCRHDSTPGRSVPTLLLDIRPDRGLTEENVDAQLLFAAAASRSALEIPGRGAAKRRPWVCSKRAEARSPTAQQKSRSGVSHLRDPGRLGSRVNLSAVESRVTASEVVLEKPLYAEESWAMRRLWPVASADVAV
jgi:hypothetical protein